MPTFDQVLSNIRTKLPIQNPLHSFVHNNVLMMFETKEFHEAITEAGRLYRANPYWPLSRYLEKYEQRKITERDIFDGIDSYSLHYHDLPFLDKLGLTLREFYYRLMFSELVFDEDTMRPEVSDGPLWEVCSQKMMGQTLAKVSKPKYRAKEYWEKYYNESVSGTTHPFLIRQISSYLDQGQSFWSNPYAREGFWQFFTSDVEVVHKFGPEWMKVLNRKLDSYKADTPTDIIQKELRLIGVPEEDWESYLLELLFDLKGWSGMVNKLEVEPWQATIKAPKIALVDFIAAFLLLETSLDKFHADQHSIDLAVIYGRQETTEVHGFNLTMMLYNISRFFKLEPRWMHRFSSEELLELISALEEAESVHQIRLWHEAYENHFYREALNAVVFHKPVEKAAPPTDAQVLFCIDDREESIRRHLEEIAPELRTFGVVGFFGLDMKFSSVKHSRLIAQCPPVVSPSRIVKEVAKPGLDAQDFIKKNQLRGSSDLSLYYNSRTLFRGFFSTIILGVVSIVPMFLQVFFPKASKAFREFMTRLLAPVPPTEIAIDAGGEGVGYTKAEQAKIVETILKMCGLTNQFAELVVLLAHGSTSNNNPFKQAYGCGACGGNAGVPNSRAFAKMANDPNVRRELLPLGVTIPAGTYFVSGFHDTATDELSYYDLDTLPEGLADKLSRVRAKLAEAGKLNAFERCQRFSSFDPDANPDQALRHVRERAEDMAQPRPEYGHSSNALAIVGRRDMTKGLFLNRRSFLLSYDWEIDPTGEILFQIVLGGIPVAVNINMDYYFSAVDNDNFGCGSKLPLNLTSLLGVMSGSIGDLRIGLARQMVEIHEPIRNMTIIQAPLDRVRKTFTGHPRLKRMLYNHWMRLVVQDPETKTWHIFRENDFVDLRIEQAELKKFSSSMDLIKRTHTEDDFAEITN